MKIFIHPHTQNNFQVKWCCPRTELIVLEGLKKLDEVELVDSEELSDYVIWHHVPQNNGQKSFEIINRINPKKLVVIDSIDEHDQYFVESFNPENYFLYFKRSRFITNMQTGKKLEKVAPERVFNWDYAILDGMIQPEQEKVIDIGCYLRHSCLFRSLVLNTITSFPYPNKKVGEVSSGSRSNGTEVYFDPIYFDHLAKTRIIVSSGPFQWTGCSRPSEAFANKCLYMADEAYRGMPNRPEPNVHWVQINPLDGYTIFSALDFLLRYPQTVQAIAERGYEHAIRYHTSKSRMEYVLQKIKEYR